jgi:hyperosmotically inducible periplasmic protein
MKTKLLQQVLVAGALLAGTAFGAGQTNLKPAASDQDIAKNVQHALLNYSDFTVFDDLSFQVQNGQVTLFGAVTEPFKKSDMQNIAAKVPGVNGVANNIQVLPFSDNDNLLRREIATALRHDPALGRYQIGTHPSIHILVNNGQVTLAGAVNTQSDKDAAAIRATAFGMKFGSIVNNLQVVPPSRT